MSDDKDIKEPTANVVANEVRPVLRDARDPAIRERDEAREELQEWTKGRIDMVRQRDEAIKERDEARAEVAKLKEQLTPELFWDDDDPEQCHMDPWDILDPHDRGTIVEIQRAARLPNVFGFIAEVDGEDEEFYFDTHAQAETELAKVCPEPVSSERKGTS